MEITQELLMGSPEEKRAVVAQFNLMDDDFFSVVMQDKDACEYLLSRLLDMPINIIDHHTQYSIRNLENHSVVLDAYAESEGRNQFDIEVHIGNEKDLPRRIRYYHAAIDFSSLKKGVPYEKLPELYIIYISDVDIFGKNKNHYEAKLHVEGTDITYDDGIHRLFFNTVVDDGTGLSELLQYLAHSDPNNNKFGALSQAVNHHKIRNEGVDTMCKAVEEYANKRSAEAMEKGLVEGMTKGKVEAVKNMLKKKFTLDDALDCIGLDKQTYEKYANEQ